MKNKLKLAYCLSLFLSISSQIANAQYPAYDSNHECNNKRYATTGTCGLLNRIRFNGEVATSTTEPAVLLAAHRGLWGGNVPENTSQAFDDAIADGIKLLEADIMPTGITNYSNPNEPSTFGTPGGMVCFHDFRLKRMTNSTSDDYVFGYSTAQLTGNYLLRKPRDINNTPVNSRYKIYSMLGLVEKAFLNKVVACLDVKNLENNGINDLTAFTSDANKLLSLAKNIKWILTFTPKEHLPNVAIKTYQSYSTITNAVLAGEAANSDVRTNIKKILWIPMIANNDIFKNAENEISVYRVNEWINNWNNVKEQVLYFEVNINSDSSNDITSKLSNKVFLEVQSNNNPLSACSAINEYTGRRVGIFSEEPVGSRGTVNRWGTWKYKDPSTDRRGDPLWLMNDIPEMKKGVITTDRPDVWKSLKNDAFN